MTSVRIKYAHKHTQIVIDVCMVFIFASSYLCVGLHSLQTATDSHTSHITAGGKNHKDFLY